ncbi:MAG: nucleotidyltransferase family protein [Thiohalocapsa sp.]|jgi:molybdenum cofactor cytidylyltransferase|uniref:nucleotidyltransferase family protein n=1 Tax=Thiohalocapsa sp. TaxID=2497641 RepID=UPI0025EE8083|nr:nucleotidyltransferase family protein [Thiohalocapsa sp.]MCG6941565.1 nucleotidyltransferase family protein [Thiohalocapsa sp.]
MSIRALLLAAGSGRRFGGDKLSALLADGTPMCVAAARNLLAAGCDVLAVVRAPEEGVGPVLRRLGVVVIGCADAHLGMGHSLACGVGASQAADGWVVALGDMPFLQPATIAAVARAVAAGAGIAAPTLDGRRGHPVGFGARWRDALLASRGDQGARALLVAHADQLVTIPVDDPGILQDLDRPGDLATGPVWMGAAARHPGAATRSNRDD